MGKKAAAKVLRPEVSGPPTAAERMQQSIDEANAQLRPESAGGSVNLAGADLTAVGREYVDFLEEESRLDDLLDKLKAKMKHREEWILENMRTGGVKRFTVAGTSGASKTLSENEDWIVSKGKGVTTEQLAAVLCEIGIPELIDQAVNANTLKATVKQQMATAGLAGDDGKGERAYCRKCSTFHPIEVVGHNCPACESNTTLADVAGGWGGVIPKLVRVIDGIPAELRAVLYVEKKYKLGARSA